MTARDLFLDVMRQRRNHQKGSPDWNYLTRAARTYVWIMRRVPTTEWTE